MKKISKKKIVDIREFMFNNCGIEYTGDRKLTHLEMMEFLRKKAKGSLERKKLDRVKKEEILLGYVVFVKDETGKVLAYRNPVRLNSKALLAELNTEKTEVTNLRRRREILSEQGLIQFNDGMVAKKEELEENQERYLDNRTKKLMKRDGIRMRGVY